jgi:hypothetical protein
MNELIIKKIKEEFNVDASYYDEGCYYYDDENGHSEWNLEGELVYSDHFIINDSE